MSSTAVKLQSQPRPLTPLESAISGATSGVVSRFVISPFDVVKIRLQLQSSTKSIKYSGVVDCCRTVVAEEGVLALWKGNMPAALLYFSYGAVQFWAYDEVNRLLSKQRILSPSQQKFAAGAVAGSVATVATYPFDLLRTRFAIQGSGNAKVNPHTSRRNPVQLLREIQVYQSMRHAVREILHAEGVRGLYQGVGPSLMQIVPYMGLMFGTYERLKAAWGQLDSGAAVAPGVQALAGYETFVCGGLAGIISKTGVFPFDTIRKRMQIQGPTRTQYVLDLPHYRNLSAFRIAVLLVRQEGVLALYKGLVPGLIKAGPSSAMTFGVVEITKKLLIKLDRRKET
ncbi:mitochondrial thiamine pyrophosphate transporter [Sorochytrium milnesiophthora]